MDRKTILEQGLLVDFLLGELSPQEENAVAKALKKDEVLRKEYRKLESDFEKLAMENAISPPIGVRDSLEDRLKSDTREQETPVRSVRSNNAYSQTRLMVAASLAAIFALSSFWLYNQWQTAEENTKLAREEQYELQRNYQNLSEEIEQVKEMYSVMNDQNAIPLLLKGNDLAPEARAIAYVNHKDRSVFVNPKALPALSEEETYQMWADVDGEMISMGLLPTDQELVTLTYIDRATSLNITIEPKGGNDHPTVERLISNVYL